MLRFIKASALRRKLARLEPCPLPTPLDLTQARRVLVFAPHPDDESLGCGGTLAQLAALCPVKVVLITDGSGAGGLPDGSAAVRQAEMAAALIVLGVPEMECLNQPDGFFTDSAAFRRQVQKILAQFQPDWIFLPSPLDYHRDHVRIAASLVPLCQGAASVQKLLFYEVWAPVPATHVVDITEQAIRKQAALDCHATAMRCADYQRAIDGLNRYRGLYLGKGRLAEAFWVEPVPSLPLFAKVQSLALHLLARLTRQDP